MGTIIVKARKHGGWGGKRSGSGRKPKAFTQSVTDLFERYVSDQDMSDIIAMAVEQAKAGDRHARMFVASYRYGKPHETIHTVDDTPILVMDE